MTSTDERDTDQQVPFGRPMLDADEIEAVTRVLSGPTLVHGPATRDFEEAFSRRIGADRAISVSSCTAALHLSLLVSEVSRGDKVIVPAMTHVATAHAVEYCGATPVFVDVEAESGNIDPRRIAEIMADDVRAAIAVHYLGLPCDMDAIMPILAERNTLLIEDCALAVDATYGEKKVGTFGRAGCFSFYPIKHVTTLEGGMITTDDDRFAELLQQRKAFGYDRSLTQRSKPGIYDVTVLGYNYRMNEVEAAIGLKQLEKLDTHQQVRARNYSILKEVLSEHAEITVFDTVQGKANSSHYCLNAVLPQDGSIDRDSVVASLKASGIGTSVHYPEAVPLMSYYREKYGYVPGQFPVAEWLAAQTISLPVGPHISEGDAERIGSAFNFAIEESQ